METNNVAVAKAINELDCEEEIKKCLSRLFIEELAPSNSGAVPQIFYVRQVEAHAENWTPSKESEA
jgi:hypothetical protein